MHLTRHYPAFLTAFAAALVTVPALAHGQHPSDGTGLIAGLLHPWSGLDHLLAMVTVGLLAVRSVKQQHRTGLWLIPAAFVGLMAVGAVTAWVGMPLPGAEWGIAMSVIVLGLLTAALPRVPVAAAAVVVGLFAIFHGYAHIQEMSGMIVAYGAGMLLSTAVLHGLGVVGGFALGMTGRTSLVRYAGAAIALGFAVTLAL